MALYDCLPLVNAIRDYDKYDNKYDDNDNDNDEDDDGRVGGPRPLSYIPSKPCLTCRPLYDNYSRSDSDSDTNNYHVGAISEGSGQDADSGQDAEADSNNDGIVT